MDMWEETLSTYLFPSLFFVAKDTVLDCTEQKQMNLN